MEEVTKLYAEGGAQAILVDLLKRRNANHMVAETLAKMSPDPRRDIYDLMKNYEAFHVEIPILKKARRGSKLTKTKLDKLVAGISQKDCVALPVKVVKNQVRSSFDTAWIAINPNSTAAMLADGLKISAGMINALSKRIKKSVGKQNWAAMSPEEAFMNGGIKVDPKI
jgi:hypothetical protein